MKVFCIIVECIFAYSYVLTFEILIYLVDVHFFGCSIQKSFNQIFQNIFFSDSVSFFDIFVNKYFKIIFDQSEFDCFVCYKRRLWISTIKKIFLKKTFQDSCFFKTIYFFLRKFFEIQKFTKR